jgi:hypothetical protein
MSFHPKSSYNDVDEEHSEMSTLLIAVVGSNH